MVPVPAPVPDAALAALFGAVAGEAAVGLAVSGGPDSTALMLLADRWRRQGAGGPRLVVLTVDHGLQDGSAAVAAHVCTQAAALGLESRILRWDHGGTRPAGDLQARAREARYRLLAGAAHAGGLSAVLLGHSLDDKAETFLLRLARGSGLSGLAAMADRRRFAGITFLRPLIGVTRASLAATVAASSLTAVDDPANRDTTRFARARVRAALPALGSIGLDVARLAATADRLADASRVLETLVEDRLTRHACDLGGAVRLSADALADGPGEVTLRLVRRIIGTVRPGGHGPRAGAAEALIAALRQSQRLRRTLGGVTIERRGDEILAYAEAGRAGFPVLPVTGQTTAIWDGRFLVTADGAPEGCLVRAAASGEGRCDLPGAVARSLPVAVQPDGSVADRSSTCIRLDPIAAL